MTVTAAWRLAVFAVLAGGGLVLAAPADAQDTNRQSGNSARSGDVGYSPDQHPATPVGRAVAAGRCRGGFDSNQYWREITRQNECMATTHKLCDTPPAYCRGF